MGKIKNWIPLLLILALLAVFYFSGSSNYFTIEWLRANNAVLRKWVHSHWLLAPVLFVGLNVATTAILLPVGVFLSVVGGFVFSPWLATLYGVTGATIGCGIVFLLARNPLQQVFKKIAGPRLQTVEKQLRQNAMNYLLLMRLIPVSPAWLINLAAAFFGVPFWTFLWTAFVGNTPSTLILAEIGSDLKAILRSQTEISLSVLLGWKSIVALVGLAVLCIAPVFIKKTK